MTTSDVSAYGVFPSFNNKTPKEGPRYIPMTFDFSSTDTWDVDMMQLQQAGKISTLQAFYIDNSVNTVELTITLGLGGQVIKVQPGYQGYMTALVNNAPKFSVSSPGGVSAIVFALNFPVVNDLWPAAPNAEATETVVVSNLEAVGGDAIALGQTTASASLPVTMASDQTALPANITKVGDAAIALGSATSAASIPVVIASDQAPLEVVATAVVVNVQSSVIAGYSFVQNSSATLAVTTSSSSVSISASATEVIRVYNYGTETAFVRMGVAATLSDFAIAPNDSGWFAGPYTLLFAICATSGTNLQISVGTGIPQ